MPSTQPQQPTDPFSLGKVLVFDKPLRWTSFDLVNKVRYMLKTRLGIKKSKWDTPELLTLSPRVCL